MSIWFHGQKLGPGTLENPGQRPAQTQCNRPWGRVGHLTWACFLILIWSVG